MSARVTGAVEPQGRFQARREGRVTRRYPRLVRSEEDRSPCLGSGSRAKANVFLKLAAHANPMSTLQPTDIVGKLIGSVRAIGRNTTRGTADKPGAQDDDVRPTCSNTTDCTATFLRRIGAGK